MTYSIRIGFLLAILSVIFGAGVYARFQSPTIASSVAAVGTQPVFNRTREIIAAPVESWTGNLNHAIYFQSLIHEAYDIKSTVKLWPEHFTRLPLVKKHRQIFHDVFTRPALTFSYFDAKTQGLSLLWPHMSGHRNVISTYHATTTSAHASDDLFLTETQEVKFHALHFMPPYVDAKAQMQKGLFPHRFLHIIRPAVIYRETSQPEKTVFSASWISFLSAIDMFKQFAIQNVNIIWEYPLAHPQQTEVKHIIFQVHPYRFASHPHASPSPFSLAPIVIQSAALMGDAGHTQLVLRLSQKPFYIIRSDATHQTITLAIDNVNPDISSIPPLDTQGTAIQNVTFNVSPESQLLITLSLLPQTEIQGLRYQEDNLVIDVGLGKTIQYLPTNNSADVTTGNVQPLIKKAVPLTDTQLAAQNYDEAVDLLNQGNTQGAIGMLQMLTTQHPDYLEGRLLLANLLLQQNQNDQALATLNGVTSRPSFSDNVTYYNLLAEAYRQSGDYTSAIQLYQRLLATDQSNGALWVGLGMCFEGLEQAGAANEAYQKALMTGNLSPVLQTFVSRKLEASK